MENPVQAVVTALVVAIALVLGVIVVDNVATGADTGTAGERTAINGETVVLDGTGTWTRIDTASGYDETVYNSRGYSVNLTGANDSYVQSESDLEIASDNTWTLSVWGYVDSAAENDTQTLVSLDGRVILDYNGSQGVWTAWYYDEGSRDSYRVNATATGQPSSWAHLTVRANDTHLAIYRNGSVGETQAITSDSIASVNVDATNWNGRMDELRTFDDPLSDATINDLSSQPNHPQKGTKRTARAMFDEPNRATQRLFYSGTGLETSNVTYSGGLPGEVMDGVSLWNAVTGATDYRWDTDGPRIQPVSGGELDGAPVAYVDYDFESATDTIVRGFGDSVRMAAIFPLLLVAVMVIVRLRVQ